MIHSVDITYRIQNSAMLCTFNSSSYMLCLGDLLNPWCKLCFVSSSVMYQHFLWCNMWWKNIIHEIYGTCTLRNVKRRKNSNERGERRCLPLSPRIAPLADFEYPSAGKLKFCLKSQEKTHTSILLCTLLAFRIIFYYCS
jgi:hypothetical protein